MTRSPIAGHMTGRDYASDRPVGIAWRNSPPAVDTGAV